MAVLQIQYYLGLWSGIFLLAFNLYRFKIKNSYCNTLKKYYITIMTITNKIEIKKMEITTKQKKTLVLKTGFMFFMQNIISFFPFDFGVKCDLDMFL